MKKKNMNKFLSLVLCLALTFALALSGCGNKDTSSPEGEASDVVENVDDNVLGEGEVVFMLDVTNKEGKETHFEIHTDKATVGEALLEVELVEGTTSEYGLMIDTVDGEKLDFNEDGMYWAFLIDGEYAETGVDSTEVVEGTTYSLVASE